mgnify:CR=1 FL=1
MNEETEDKKESTKKKPPTITYLIVDGKGETIYEGDSRVECINPKLVDDEDYKKAREALSLGQNMMKEFLKNI